MYPSFKMCLAVSLGGFVRSDRCLKLQGAFAQSVAALDGFFMLVNS